MIVLDPAKKDALGGAATFKQVLFTVAALQAPSCRPADTPHFRAREEAIIKGYLRSAGAYDVSARYVQILLRLETERLRAQTHVQCEAKVPDSGSSFQSLNSIRPCGFQCGRCAVQQTSFLPRSEGLFESTAADGQDCPE